MIKAGGNFELKGRSWSRFEWISVKTHVAGRCTKLFSIYFIWLSWRDTDEQNEEPQHFHGWAYSVDRSWLPVGFRAIYGSCRGSDYHGNGSRRETPNNYGRVLERRYWISLSRLIVGKSKFAKEPFFQSSSYSRFPPIDSSSFQSQQSRIKVATQI